jgi:hypothetical protein
MKFATISWSFIYITGNSIILSIIVGIDKGTLKDNKWISTVVILVTMYQDQFLTIKIFYGLHLNNLYRKKCTMMPP